MNTILVVGIILLFGIISSYLSGKTNIPKVVGFVLTGILLGPHILNIIDKQFLLNSHIIIDIALSFISFMIGGSLKVKHLKNLGKTIFSISLFQAQGTFLFSSGVLYLVLPIFISNSTILNDEQFYLTLSLFLGAIATATAPAAVLAIIHELKAKGKFTTTLLAIIAVDDSLALINFILVASVTTFIINGTNLDITQALYLGFSEISFAVVLGIIAAWVLILFEKFIISKSGKVIMVFAVMMITFGLAQGLNLDGILCTMTLGAIFANYGESFDFIYEEINAHFENLIFILFFIISGAHLNFYVVTSISTIALIYLLVRGVGKIAGSYIGALIVNEEYNIKRYMGLALFPQAGVSIGLALSIGSMSGFEIIAEIILSVIITTTALNELIGPILTRYAIRKAGESNESN